jgi:hypothetical protein
VVDFECPWNIPEKAVCDGKLWNFVSYVERTLGKTPMIYTGFYFWQDHTFCGPSWAKYPLWLAWYAPENVIRVPPPWSKWTIWQYTGNGPGPQYGSEGLSLDMDWFNGTPEELSAFIHGEPPVPPAPAPVPTYPQYLTLVGVNVRSGPTDISPVIGTLPADATISVDTIDAYHGRSHYSSYSGKPGEPPAGWVWTAYTKLVATPVPGPALPQYKVNPGYNLNIHSGPSGTTSVIGLAAAGTVMYIDQGPTNGYIHFDNSVGIHNPSLPSNGWVWGPYCSQV